MQRSARAGSLLIVIALAGCGFLSVGERAIPSVPGAVAATAWQSQDASTPDIGDTSSVDSPDAFLDRLAEAIEQQSPPGATWQHGVLSRQGDQAVGYFQLSGSSMVAPVLAFEARLTLTRGAGGWAIVKSDVRQQCARALVAGQCDDNRGGGSAPSGGPAEPPG